MIEIPLTQESIRWGKKELARREKAGARNYFRSKGRDTRWTGLAAEHAFYQWAKEQGLPIKWNGGMDSKADFEIGNGAPSYRHLQMAFKINNGAPSPDFQFMLNVHHPGQLADGVLLGIVNTATKTLYLAGYIAANRVRQCATRARKGDDGFIPGRKVAYDCWVLSARALEPAEMFFELIRRAA